MTYNDESVFHATITAHGLYDPFHFVMRLSPVNHQLLSSQKEGLYTGDEIKPEITMAFSTALHESIHWWQHIGSTAGFLSSLTYPVQSHVNLGHLRRLKEKIGPQKSIRKVAEYQTRSGGPDTVPGMANSVVNNYYDIYYFQKMIHNQQTIEKIVEDPVFECEGWCYQIGYGNILALLAQTADPKYLVIPDPRPREAEFKKLKLKKARGFYYGSPISICPIGTKEIFEGQARFIQMQYLYWGSGRKHNWDYFKASGMLTPLYMKAFDTFLEFTDLETPSSIENWIVGLFLLVCDIAINPGAGFPLGIDYFETFTLDVNPGMRFLMLCAIIRKNHSKFENCIQLYDHQEYFEICDLLIELGFIENPTEITKTIAEWADASLLFKKLMNQYRTFQYEPLNLTVALLLSHLIALNIDKAKRPEFFCWTGAWMAGPHVSEESAVLFNNHKPLFVDKENDDGIFPRTHPDKNMVDVQRTFETFYQAILGYDLTRQWMVEPGPFAYDHRWLSSTADPANLVKLANSSFEVMHKVHPDSFKLL